MTNIHNIPKTGGMNVPGVVYASNPLFEMIKNGKTIEQIKNVAKLPGIIDKSIALADAHQGYGFSIGGVAAFGMEDGVVSPGGVGYDINCGVRMLKTNLTRKDITPKSKELLEKLFLKVPSGVGRGSPFQLSLRKLDQVLENGVNWLVEEGYATNDDLLHMEEEGCMPEANPELVSDRAKKRGIGQLGTLGAGNHFLEVQYVDEIFESEAAKVFGLKKDQVIIMIHCGSRGLGHQVASDYIKKMEEFYGVNNLPDRELINAPIKSKLGQEYLSAMACAANFAFCNRQVITHWTREAFTSIFPKSKINVIYDVCHNIAKIEEHIVGKEKKDVCVHRKGATRSFGPNNKNVPEDYRKVGQPVLIPGSMGTSSYILIGTKKAEELTFGSTVHGAGRVMSRSKAIKTFDGEKVKSELDKSGINVRAGSIKSFSEEGPKVYKDIEEVIKTVTELGINKKVARVKPLLVIKG